MNEPDPLKRSLVRLRTISPPKAVRVANREVVRRALEARHAPWWRTSVVVPVPAALALAGALVISLGLHLIPEQRVEHLSSSDGVVDLPSSSGASATVGAEGSVAKTSDSSDQLEVEEDPSKLRRQVAEANPREQITLLRRAGDIYLQKFGDIERALTCYQQVLELLSPEERAEIDPKDSWLLAELKNSMTTQDGRS